MLNMTGREGGKKESSIESENISEEYVISTGDGRNLLCFSAVGISFIHLLSLLRMGFF